MDDGDFKQAESSPVEIPKNERQWAMGCHLAALVGCLAPYFAANFLAPMIVWLLKREDGPFIDEQGKEALNFQLSILLYVVVCGLLFLVVIGAFLIFPLLVFGFVCPIIGAVKASEGKRFRYPACIRFIK